MSHESVGLVAICLGAYLGAFVQSFVVDLDCGRGPSAILTTTYQIKVQSVNFMEFCDRKGYGRSSYFRFELSKPPQLYKRNL